MSLTSAGTLESSLTALLAAYGPPGRETGVRALLRRQLRGVGTLAEDATGNLHVRRTGSGPRLLLTAHMDALGIIITRVDRELGQARIAVLGSRKPVELVGAPVRFEGDRLALISWDRPGVKNGGEPEADQLVLETGLWEERGTARRRGFDVGDVAAIDDRPIRLGEYWCAANLDNRAGCAVLVRALTRPTRVGYDIYGVFTAQSELGARGATTGAFGVEPDLAIVLDVAHLGEPKETSGFAIGKGPCVALKEQGFLAHPETLDLVRRAARVARVPLQYLIREGEGSDARAVRAARTGVPTAVIAIPARRSGGIWSLVHARDLAQTADLVTAILAGSPKRGRARPTAGAGRAAKSPRKGRSKRSRNGGRR